MPEPPAEARVRRVGLTGGIATGKTWVRARFEDLGVPTIDADTIAREAVAPGTPGLAAVVARFGREVLTPSGALDRKHIGRIVFSDPAARRALEGIIHPNVRRTIDQWFASVDPEVHRWALADIPLLYETGRAQEFDSIIVTACDPATQVKRVMQRDGLSEDEARRRIAAQLPIQDKVARADYVIRTDGSHDETDAQVTKVWKELSGG